MKWCIVVLFLASLAAALPPHDQGPQQVRRVVAHRRAPAAAPIHLQAGARIPPPVNAPVRRVQAVRVVPATHVQNPKPLRTIAVSSPFKAPLPNQPNVHRGATKGFPGVRTLTKEESEALQRQIQQWQIAVVGGQVQPGYPGAPQPPPSGPTYPAGPAYPAGPGTIWIQVPAGAYPPTYPQPGPPAPPSEPQPPAPPSGPQPPPPPSEPQPPAPPSSEPQPPAPPSEPQPAPPSEPQLPTIPEAPQGSEQPTGQEEASEGVEPVEEGPAGEEIPPPVAPTEVPAEQGGASKPEEVAPPPAVPEVGAGGAPGAGVSPGGEAPSEGGAPPPATGPGGGGDGQEDKLVHCKEPRGQFPHESSCTKYYNCWDDVVVEGSCPFGLAFSETHSYCDFPENVDCGGRSMDDTSLPIEESGGCSTPYGSYRSKTNCSEFVICDNGTPIMFACPSELFYNDELGVCDYPYRVNCQNPPQPVTPPEAPATEAPVTGGGEQPPPAEAPATGGGELPPPPASIPDALRGLPQSFFKAGSPCWHSNIYPLNNVCSRVAVCRSGTTSILACPKGMAYDVYKRRCLPYYRARC